MKRLLRDELMKTIVALLLTMLIVGSLPAVGQSNAPALPTTWVDLYELTCQITSSCSPGSPGLSLTPPTTTLTLSVAGGTFVPSRPACMSHPGG